MQSTFFVCRCSDVPLAPVDLRVTSTDAGSISLAWDVPKSDGGPAITGYIVELCLSGSTTDWTTGVRVDNSCLSAELTGLSENDLYFVRIFSENKIGVCETPCELSEPISAKKRPGKLKQSVALMVICSFTSRLIHCIPARRMLRQLFSLITCHTPAL